MKKIITFLLLVLIISLCSSIAFAGYDDGADCWNCGHYHWGDWMCDGCGACSDNCDNSDCYEETHCPGCGECLLTAQLWCEECGFCDDCQEESHCPECGVCYVECQIWCDDCGLCEECAADLLVHCLFCNQCSSTGYEVCEDCGACEECWVAQETHCLYCGQCYAGDEDEMLCQSCFVCDNCVPVCEYCHECEDCAVFAHEHHCELCGNCFEDVPQCEEGYMHCQDCCLFCEQCERCLLEDGGELCDNCGLCEDCCKENAEAMDCSCGEYCVESSEWEEHICRDCGTPFCNVEQCEYCELCLDCCESNSDCNDSEPVCVENPEYEEHFCEDCGRCFHEVDMCEDCLDDDRVYRCVECCEELQEETGEHKATAKAAWEFNDTHHYHECKYCDEYEHYTGAEKHKFDQDGICTVCKYNNGTKGIITQHPKNVTATVTDVKFGDDNSPLSSYNNKVIFSITAKDAKSYQWYYKYDDTQWREVKDDEMDKGSKTNTLTITVPSDGCNCQYSYKCVVIGNDGKTYESSPAMLICKHAFDYGYGESVTTKSLGEFYYKNGTHMAIYESSGHKIPCLGEGCELYASKEITPHVYKDAPKEVTDKDGVKWNQYTCKTCRYNYFVKQSEDKLKDQIKVELKKINSVEVKAIDFPKVGSKPDYTGTVGDASYALKKYSNETIENGITWYDISEQKDLKVKTDTFKADHDYKVKIYLTVTAGYEFAEKVTGKISDKVTTVLVQDNQVILSIVFKAEDNGAFVAEEKTFEQKQTELAEQKKENEKPKTKEEIKEELKEKAKESDGKSASWSKASDWAVEELNKANDLGVIPNIFKKKDLTENISRKEFAHISVKLWEKLTGNKATAVANNPFKDTDDVEILKAYNIGITVGTGADTFSPNDLITREQMATMMARGLAKAGIDTTVDVNKVSKFADDGEMHDWGKESIYYMSNIGIIKGMGDNKFGVLGNATREQALLISERSAEKFAK